LDKYISLLKENNIKITHHRLAILKYLDEHHNHPTADDIYSKLKSKNPSLSKTTVYNSLDILQKYGIVSSLTICGSEYRYDINEGMHHHFLCKQCGCIIDIDIKCPNIEKVGSYGHVIEEVHGYFKGLCKNCINKRGEKNESKNSL
jgi:Fe2+ or Zn2+ uptake regulation protein